MPSGKLLFPQGPLWPDLMSLSMFKIDLQSPFRKMIKVLEMPVMSFKRTEHSR